MKLFGSLKELVSIVYRKNSQEITLRPNQATTYTANRDIQTPPQDADSVLVSQSATQTLSNKTLDNSSTITVKDSLLTIQDDGDTSKQAKFQASGISTATTRTYTLPDANTTVVGTDATQSLSNKTLDNTNTVTVKDTLLTIQDDGDTSKQLRFQASGITTATIRTLTAPDANTTIVGTDATQTITNKNLASSTNSLTGATAASFTNTGTVTLFTASDTVVGRATTDALTNKDIDGSTASNTSRITLPKAATATLNALTRKQGTIVYDTTTNAVKYDDGSVLTALAASSTATPTSQGTVTSYFPIIQSAVTSTQTGDFTVTTTDGFETIIMSPSGGGGDRTVNLPAAASNTGRRLIIKKINTGTEQVIIDGNSSETIDGYLTIVLRFQYAQATIVCNGSAWYVESIFDSGTYTPTVTSIANVTSVTGNPFQVMRSGHHVTMHGYISLTASATSGVAYKINLPIASDFTSGDDAVGLGGNNPNDDITTCSGLTADDTIRMDINPSTTSGRDHYFSIQYRIR